MPWRVRVTPSATDRISAKQQPVALFRALRPEDVQPAVYRVTVRWFVVAVSVRVIGVLLAAFEIALD